ncbi:hypothetical protein [Enterovibrio calviensis]|uniref:hypothetical protein n=1 Tax=Enterovibrio calviensis TaxID=91359 RepID=UPI003736A8E3
MKLVKLLLIVGIISALSGCVSGFSNSTVREEIVVVSIEGTYICIDSRLIENGDVKTFTANKVDCQTEYSSVTSTIGKQDVPSLLLLDGSIVMSRLHVDSPIPKYAETIKVDGEYVYLMETEGKIFEEKVGGCSLVKDGHKSRVPCHS